tara:strand:+ start:210 stop:1457 length:1248 start_codon:yes stop_codon:yes gene_type:complete
MLGLGNARPSMQYQQLNQAFQSDPRRILGQALMGQGASTAPVRTPLQGLGRLSSALIGAYLQRRAGDTQVEREAAMTDQIMGMLGPNVAPNVRAAVAANPAAAQSALLAAQFAPTTSSELVNLGEFTGVQTTQTNPLTQQTSTSIGQLVQPRAAAKQDFVTLVDPQDPTKIETLALGDARIQTLLGQGYVERQGAGTSVSVTPSINIANEQAQTFATEEAKSAVATIKNLREQVAGEADLITRLNIADRLLESGTETGPITNLTMPIRNLGRQLGFLNDEQIRDLNNQQVLTAAFNYIIPRMRVVGSGATSDFEARLFTSATANMANTPEANKALVKSMQALVERRADILKAMETYAKDNNSLIGFAEYADENVAPALKAYMTDAEFDKAVDDGELKNGDLYFNGLLGTFEIYEG